MAITFINKDLTYVVLGSEYPHTIWGSATSKLYTAFRLLTPKDIACALSDEDGSSLALFIAHTAAIHGGDGGPPAVAIGQDANLQFYYPIGSATLGWSEFTTVGVNLNRNNALYTHANYNIMSVAAATRPSGNIFVIIEEKKVIPPVDYQLRYIEMQDDGNPVASGTLFSSSFQMVEPSCDWDVINDRLYVIFSILLGTTVINKLSLLDWDMTLLSWTTINSGYGYGHTVGVAVSNEGHLNTVTQINGDLSWQRWEIAATIGTPDQAYDKIVDESIPVVMPTLSLNKNGGYLNFIAQFPTNGDLGFWRWQDPEQDSVMPDPAFDLQTNNQGNPIDINPAAAITFKWRPQVASTAHQIIVSDDLRFLTSIWDSGKVADSFAASATASATYGGPTLDEDTSYYWKVYYWDGSDVQSEPPVTPPQFRTGFADSFMIGDIGNEYKFEVAPWPYEETEQKFIDVKRQVDKRGNFYSFDPFAGIRIDIASASATMIDSLRAEWEAGIPMILVPYPRSDKVLDFRNKISGSASPIPHEVHFWKAETIASATISNIETHGSELSNDQYSDISRRDGLKLRLGSAANKYTFILARFDLSNWINTYGINSVKRVMLGLIGDGKLTAIEDSNTKYGWRIEAWSNSSNDWNRLDYDENRPADTEQLDIGHHGVIRHEITNYLNASNEVYFRFYMPHPRDTSEGQNHHEFFIDFLSCYINSFVIAINEFPPRYVYPFADGGFDLSLICEEV